MADDDGAEVLVLGSLNMDVVLTVAALPQPGETVLADTMARYPGGKGANQAVAAARIGVSVAMIGAVGADDDGDRLRAALAADAVDTRGVAVRRDAPSGMALIAIDAAGENQIIVAGGANRRVSAGEAGVATPAAVRLAQLETPIEAAAAFLRQAPAGTVRLLNAAPFVSGAQSLFADCDIVIVNETELAAFAGTGCETAEAVPAAARGLIAAAGQTIVVTRGAAGAVAITADAIEDVAAPPATVVDTVGAGDCFCGVLAAGLARGLDLRAALTLAAAAAAIAVGRAGAIPSLPAAADLTAMQPVLVRRLVAACAGHGRAPEGGPACA